MCMFVALMLIIGHLWSQDQYCGASRLLVGTGGAGKHLSHLRQMFPAEVSSFSSPTEKNCSFVSLFSAIFPVFIFLVADIMSKIGPNSGLKCHLPFYVQGHDRPWEKTPLLDISAKQALGLLALSSVLINQQYLMSSLNKSKHKTLLTYWSSHATRGLQECPKEQGLRIY